MGKHSTANKQLYKQLERRRYSLRRSVAQSQTGVS
jgi:hypothetical protein